MNSENLRQRNPPVVDRSSMIEAHIPADRLAPGAARRLVRSWLDGHRRTDDAVIAVSEVVTNAVLHGLDGPDRLNGGSLTVRLVTGDGIRIEVDQPTIETVDAPSGFPGPDEFGGRGLAVIEALADRWGVTYGTSPTTLTTVWFEM